MQIRGPALPEGGFADFASVPQFGTARDSATKSSPIINRSQSFADSWFPHSKIRVFTDSNITSAKTLPKTIFAFWLFIQGDANFSQENVSGEWFLHILRIRHECAVASDQIRTVARYQQNLKLGLGHSQLLGKLQP